VFLSSGNFPRAIEVAGWYSTLSVGGKEREIVEAIRDVFPIVEDLSIQISAGSPVLFAKVKGVNDKIPVNLVSAGITRLLAMVLAIHKMAGGIVCIDEIENGFHFEILESVWKLIERFSTSTQTQVFATSHSQECIAAATNAISDARKRLRFLKLSRQDGYSTVKDISGQSLRSAVQMDVEVR
jgi:AAA15 family ATPase/GTPase